MPGVILTLPEYILSFQLKLYDTIRQKDYALARGISSVLKMIHKDVRSILDESDELLQPKRQIIYPVGRQMDPDGGDLRWTVAQAVLKRVPGHMRSLWAEHGDTMVEFDESYIENSNIFDASTLSYRDDVFTPCRILDDTMFKYLRSALIADLKGMDIDFPKNLTPDTKNDLELLLTQKELEIDPHSVINECCRNENEKNTVWILRGLLSFEVLKLVLTKRWRVNYGVDVNGRRKMAIPFGANDTPKENSEFGHPDVAVCYTMLSYYYSGNIEFVKFASIDYF